MRSAREIEIQAIRVLDRLQKGQFHEDSLIEVKRELSDPYKAARRIAGHCNAASGQQVLWIIGADEKDGIVGWTPPDFAQYLPQVWKHFDCVPPQCIDVAIEFSGKACTAFGFYAAHPPYLVKNPAFGKEPGHAIENEIPWRDGTRVRTARRDEIMRLLTDHALSPDIETFGGHIFELPIRPNVDQPPEGFTKLRVEVAFYVMPRSDATIIVPHHRIKAELSDLRGTVSSCNVRFFSFSTMESHLRAFEHLLRRPPSPQVILKSESADSVKDTGTEVLIFRAAHVTYKADILFPTVAWAANDQFAFELVFPVGPDRVPFKVSFEAIRKRA